MPGLLSNSACLTVIWYLSWSLLASCAQIRTDEVSDVQYGRLESNVTLACGKSQIRTDVMWRHNNGSVQLWHRVMQEGHLVLFHVDQSAQGSYSCYDNSGLLLHSVTLRLGYPPGLLSISCQMPSHSFVHCSWRESLKTFLPAKFNASLRGKSHERKQCIMDSTHRKCYVTEPTYWETLHTLGVTETNALGNKTTYVQMRLNELLKPDPPESVSVQEIEGAPTSLNISWSYPASWPERIGFFLNFHVRYRPKGSMHWSEVYTAEKDVVVHDALAGHYHQVQVRAQDSGGFDGQWSDWCLPEVSKPWEDDDKTASSPVPTEDLCDILCETFFTQKPRFPVGDISVSSQKDTLHGDEGSLGLVILLAFFSVFIITTVLSLIFVVWARQRRREHATEQELASMVKMKPMPI